MSAASRKGYAGERPIEVLMLEKGHHVRRPRAGQPNDVGDLEGLPYVLSIKNQAELRLSSWVNDLEHMVVNAGTNGGVVWHKKKGKASPLDWYVTTSGRLWLPVHDLLMQHWEIP